MHRRLSILIAITTAAMLGPARATPPAELTQPVFEMFRLAPGKTEAFIRSMAEWDKVNGAGGQPQPAGS